MGSMLPYIAAPWIRHGLGESSNHSWPKLRQGFQAMERHQGPPDRRQNRHGGLLHDGDTTTVAPW